MSQLSQKVSDDIKTAMREKDKVTLGTLRMLLAALKNTAIDKGGAGTALDDAEVCTVIRKEIKKRQDSIEQYEKAGRTELAEIEQAEITVLQKYLPFPLSESELDDLVNQVIAETGATSKKDMGQVMKLLQEKSEGRADGKALSKAVSARLQ